MDIALSPESLAMVPDNCLYCYSEIDVKSFEIRHSYGIKACLSCYVYAERDSNAFMHREGIIPVDYAMEHHALKDFTNILLKEFHVKRSSGLIEVGWTLDTGSKINRKFFVYDTATKVWLIPVKKNNLTKSISIYEIMHNFPQNTKCVAENAIKVMNTGVYIADALQHDRVVNSRASFTVEDDSCDT